MNMKKIKALALSGNYSADGGGSPESLRLLARSLDPAISVDVLCNSGLYSDIGQSASLPSAAALLPVSAPGSMVADRGPYAVLLAFGAWIPPKLWATAFTTHNGRKLPLIYFPRGSLSEIEFTGTARRLKKLMYFYLLEYWFLRRADLVVFSSALEQTSSSILGAWRNNHALIAADPTDGATLAVAPVRQDNHVKTIGLLAELHPRKGVAETIEAFRLLEREHPGQFRLVVGGGAHKSAVAYAQRLETNPPRNVRFVGRVAPLDRDAFFAALDALLVPSRYESYSLVCAEAVARRVPLICSPALGFLEGLDAKALNIGILDGVTPEAIADCLRDFEFRFEHALQTQVAARSRCAAEQLADAITRGNGGARLGHGSAGIVSLRAD